MGAWGFGFRAVESLVGSRFRFRLSLLDTRRSAILNDDCLKASGLKKEAFSVQRCYKGSMKGYDCIAPSTNRLFNSAAEYIYTQEPVWKQHQYATTMNDH